MSHPVSRARELSYLIPNTGIDLPYRWMRTFIRDPGIGDQDVHGTKRFDRGLECFSNGRLNGKVTLGGEEPRRLLLRRTKLGSIN